MVSRLTSKQLKAIAAYLKAHSYRLRLAILPSIGFITKEGEYIDVSLLEITHWMDEHTDKKGKGMGEIS